jgi:hypothetical protein
VEANLGLSGFGLKDAIFYIVCTIGLGGVWAFFFFMNLGKRSLMPVYDPNFVEMLEAKHG